MVYKAAADAFGVDQDISQKAKVGSIPEWIHTETLNLDDWQDDDEYRRGEATPHRRLEEDFGLEPHTAGSLVSNHVLGLSAGLYNYIANSSELTPDYRLELVDLMSRAEIELEQGQNIDIVGEDIDNNSIDTDYLLSENGEFIDANESDFKQTYLDMVDLKTGALVRAPLEAAVLAAGYDQESGVVDQARELGTYIGRAFQKWDDVLDVTSTEGEIGKDRFSDLEAGKKNILSETAAEMVENGEKGFLEKIRCKNYPSERELLAAGRIIEDSGAVEEVRKDALSDIKRANQILDQMPFENHEYVSDLRQLAQMAVTRDD